MVMHLSSEARPDTSSQTSLPEPVPWKALPLKSPVSGSATNLGLEDNSKTTQVKEFIAIKNKQTNKYLWPFLVVIKYSVESSGHSKSYRFCKPTLAETDHLDL